MLLEFSCTLHVANAAKLLPQYSLSSVPLACETAAKLPLKHVSLENMSGTALIMLYCYNYLFG